MIDWFDDVITGKYPPDPCEEGVCQMPDNVVSPGNLWFSNSLPENDTERKKRSLVFEKGEIAREASWPWVVGITSAPKSDYCHVEIVTMESLCRPWNNFSYLDDIVYAELEDFIHLDDIKDTVDRTKKLRYNTLTLVILNPYS